ncbi:MAG: TonB-dependent receptor, partial [Planctomycetota bacterium]
MSTAPEVIDEVVVSGNRSAGTVLSEIEPELVLTEEDIAAYGVSSIGDLIELLSRESGSGRASNGPPVVLINGRRVSGFREVGRYPVEALARVELLAEQVALSYGFAADQRVLNFVLKPDVTVTSLAGGTDRLS